MFRHASKGISHTLDGSSRGVHVGKAGAADTGSRVTSMRTPCFSRLRKRVTGVRVQRIADGCDKTARLS